MASVDEEVPCRLADCDDLPTRPNALRSRHIQMLAICSAALLLAVMFDVLPTGRVAFRGLEQFPLPESCGSKVLFGISCPACGLTRSVTLCAHGDFEGSLAYHRLGWMMFVTIVAQIPYRILALRSPTGRILPPWVGRAFSYLLIAALIVNWVWQISLSRHV